eukprot:1153447-Pelagomonas_calceolata.AAC.11
MCSSNGGALQHSRIFLPLIHPSNAGLQTPWNQEDIPCGRAKAFPCQHHGFASSYTEPSNAGLQTPWNQEDIT